MEFLTLSLTQTEPPAICRLQFIFLPGTGSVALAALVILCIYWAIFQFRGQQFALWLKFPDGVKKSGWFSVFFSFLLVKKEWWSSDSLHAPLETGSQSLTFRWNISSFTFNYLYGLNVSSLSCYLVSTCALFSLFSFLLFSALGLIIF